MNWSRPAVASLLILLALPAVAIGQQPAGEAPVFRLPGLVLDYGTERPIRGATVFIEELDRAVATDSTGAFFFVLPPGTYTFETTRLGYAPVAEPSTVEEGSVLIVRLLPQPVILEGITATADRMELRRRMAPTRVFAFEGAALATSAAPTIRQFLQERAMMIMAPCPGMSAALGNPCVLSRGRPSRLNVYLDEVPMTASSFALLDYRPSDFEVVEYFAGARMLRLYSRPFMEHLSQGNAGLSAILW